MWRLYVGGLCTGFVIGGFALWLAACLVAPEPAREPLGGPAVPLVLVPLVLAGEALRVSGGKAVRNTRSHAEPSAAPDPAGW